MKRLSRNGKQVNQFNYRAEKVQNEDTIAPFRKAHNATENLLNNKQRFETNSSTKNSPQKISRDECKDDRNEEYHRMNRRSNMAKSRQLFNRKEENECLSRHKLKIQ